MLSFRFSKTGDAVYISHIDIMRALHRTLRRMNIPLDYSQGYNPHMLLNLSQPLPLGIASVDEWATVQTDFGDPDSFVSLFNDNCPPGLFCTECRSTSQKPNIAGNVTASDYFIVCERARDFANEINNLNSKPLFITARTKAGDIQKDVSPLIFSSNADEGGIALRLAFGNTNLRIDKLSQKLNELFGLDISLSDITRTAQLIKTDRDFVTVDGYLRSVL